MNRFLLLVFLSLPLFINAQLTAKPAGTASPVGFYQFLPNGYDAAGSYKYPLVIALHGTGERGNGTSDLELVLQWGLGEMLRKNATLKFNYGGQQQAFMVLFPQLTLDYSDWQVSQIDAMIDYAVSNLNVDVNKIFLQGYSLGGGGAWLYPASSVPHANRIAGIIPTSPSPGYRNDLPGYETNNLCNIAEGRVAVWAHHSVDDDAIDVQYSRTAIDGINACSPDKPALATFYETGMHNQAWLWALDTLNNYQYPNVWEWMAGTSRLNTLANNQEPIAEAGNNITIVSPASTAVLNGSSSRDPNDVIVKYAWTKIAGPASNTIEKPGYPVTNISNLELGNYTFQLAVTDQFGVTRTDQVNVNVTTILPVGLSYFKGVNTGQVNHLTWATSHEDNADHFDILRGTDGINFSVIGSQAAGKTVYEFKDATALIGRGYYRLKSVDRDGKFSLSDIISINNDHTGIALSAYPNPVKDKLNVMVQGAFYGTLEISIHDMTGKLVKKLAIVKPDFSWKGSLNTGTLQKGVYSLQVHKAGSLKESSSFVKE